VTKLRKVFLPPWMTWFGLAVLVPMWLFVTYRVFFTEAGSSDLGTGGWVVMTLVMGIMAAVLVLMGRRKLPAYLIEEDEIEGSPEG